MSCRTSSTVVAVSLASITCLIKGVSAPYYFAIAAITLPFVDTTTLSTYLDCNPASVDQAISGLPLRFREFLCGRHLLTIRAGINANSRLLLITKELEEYLTSYT